MQTQLEIPGIEKPKVLDSKGQAIIQGSIVGMSEPNGEWSRGEWFRYQGLVVDQCTYINSMEHSVAVFFSLEVGSVSFYPDWPLNEKRKIIPINDWDDQYRQECKNGDMDFLFLDDVWKECPRIVFFRPDELVVEKDWDMSALAERVFPNHHHSVYRLKEGYPQKPEDYMCWIEKCRSTATRLALFNVWGSVHGMFVCDGCFPKVHGWCGDDFPKKKDPLRTSKGEAIQVVR